MNLSAQTISVGEKKKKKVPFIRAIIISSKSLLSLYEEITAKRGVEFILTSHLNQDCLEIFFSRIRAMGGTYTHPTTVEFIHRARQLIVGKSSELVVQTASVEMEEDNSNENIISHLVTRSVEDTSGA
jgi:hypothetical protein